MVNSLFLAARTTLTVLELPLNATGLSDITAHIGGYFSMGDQSSRTIPMTIFSDREISVLLNCDWSSCQRPSTTALLAVTANDQDRP